MAGQLHQNGFNGGSHQVLHLMSEYLKSQMAKEYVEILPVVASDGSRRVVGVLSPIDIFREQISRARAGTPAVLGDD